MTMGRKVKNVVKGVPFLKGVLRWLGSECKTSSRKREFPHCLNWFWSFEKEWKLRSFILTTNLDPANPQGRY